jgi:S-adenosylmethionine/arginine decarboxylase-like enzyme
MPYRQRLIIEGFGCRKNLDKPGFAHMFLERLTQALDMRVLVPPVVVRVPVNCPAPSMKTADHGVTGFVIWMESGAQVHTWPGDSLVTLDAYSCKEFQPAKALELFEKSFSPMDIKFAVPEVVGSCGD